MFFVGGAEGEPQNANVEGKHETSRAAAAMMQGAKMMTWRRSARPTATIYDRTIKRTKSKRSSCKQRGRPSGTCAGVMPHAAAPPGA